MGNVLRFPARPSRMSLGTVRLIIRLCEGHGLTEDQTADVFILLESKGYYA